MAPVDFDRAYTALPSYALALLENPTKEDQDRLRADIEVLVSDQTMDKAAKAQLLGVAVMRLTGPDLLEAAVKGLGDAIGKQPPAPHAG